MREDYIKGTITKLLYEGSNGYKVGLFKVKETSNEEYLNKTVTFTGTFMPINNELTYHFKGNFINHQRFGLQFSVKSYEMMTPSSEDEIVMYLSSGLFKGIGPKTAKEIVKIFKENTIEEIKSFNPLLAKIKGMNEKKARELSSKIIEYDKDESIIIEFNKLGFTTNECMLLINKYRDRCFDIIQNNIYLLSNDINFLKLDKIFLNTNDELENVRIDAIIKYALVNLCYASGDTLVEKENLYLETSKYFTKTFDSKIFISHLEDLLETKDIIKVGELYALSHFYETEFSIASTINNLLKYKDSIKEEKITRLISEFEKVNSIILNNDQRLAIISSLKNNVSIITGGPGTGKTTIIKAVVDLYEKINETELNDITLLAPTGRAAKRMQESVIRKTSTIHKFLKWNKENQEFGLNRFNPSETKLVIIDEFSMVDIFLFNSLLEALKNNVKLILVGDSNQLPSIAPGNLLEDLIKTNKIPNIFLNEIYRTASDSYIIPLSIDIKNKKHFDVLPNNYVDFKFINSSDINIRKNLYDICNIVKSKSISLDDFQVLIPMYKGENGIDNINILMQEIFNPSNSKKGEVVIRDIKYREKDKVIQLVNDVDNNIYNGDIGYIERIFNNKDQEMIINYNGNKVHYKKGKFDEIKHAYAISVHKSQGSEYDHALILLPSNMKRMLYNKLIYTAVTRVKKSLTILGSIESLNYSIKTDYSNNRLTSLKTFF